MQRKSTEVERNFGDCRMLVRNKRSLRITLELASNQDRERESPLPDKGTSW